MFEPTSELFENIILNQLPEGHNGGLMRQYRARVASSSDYQRVVSVSGEFCETPTGGSGYSQWYLYHTRDGRLVTIIKNHGWNDESIWSWQDNFSKSSIIIEEETDDDEPPLLPPVLKQTCTRFNCICWMEGKKCCEAYKIGPDFLSENEA